MIQYIDMILIIINHNQCIDMILAMSELYGTAVLVRVPLRLGVELRVIGCVCTSRPPFLGWRWQSARRSRACRHIPVHNMPIMPIMPIIIMPVMPTMPIMLIIIIMPTMPIIMPTMPIIIMPIMLYYYAYYAYYDYAYYYPIHRIGDGAAPCRLDHPAPPLAPALWGDLPASVPDRRVSTGLCSHAH